ncbi:hypothetical protein E2C01_087773 [Portunus trituberculatus]|uniref:Uncharacterized protein n=1 Tax=Portunus trituberculatus TaxID=210409 RepID=A0A5B7J7I1_PORTR|nr:hypothetical protein [Portunus trituberculatus]
MGILQYTRPHIHYSQISSILNMAYKHRSATLPLLPPDPIHQLVLTCPYTQSHYGPFSGCKLALWPALQPIQGSNLQCEQVHLGRKGPVLPP